MGTMTSALVYTRDFLGEQQSELYEEYCSRAAQPKNMWCAKNAFTGRTLFALERCGA